MSGSTLESLLFDQIVEAALPVPDREVRFHPIRKWRFDFYWSREMVACEVEGGIWMRGGGRHNRPTTFIRDTEKYNEAALMGITVIRVTDKHVKDGSALEWIRRAHGCERVSISKRCDIVGDEKNKDADTD